jgi:hypothetical protein
MKILPYEKFSINTSKSKEEVMGILRQNTLIGEGYPGLFMRYKGNAFFGQIYDDSFQIIRLIRFRSGFRPLIEGKATGDDNGTSLDITIRLPKFAVVFWIVWMSFCLLLFTVAVVVTFTQGLTPMLFFMPPFASLGYLILRMQFVYHAPESKVKLYELLKD